MSPPTPSSQHPISNTEVVTGQSALWGLLSLALNAMLQRSVLDQFDAALSPARSSPLVCLADSCLLIIWPVYGVYNKIPCKESLTIYLEESKSAGQDGSGPESWTTRLLLFGLGALPQALKLLGMQGVPWTKAWGAMFFLSSLINGPMQFLGTHGLYQRLQQGRVPTAASENHKMVFNKVRRVVFSASLVGHAAVLIWIWYTLIMKLRSLGGPNAEKWFELFATMILSLFILLWVLQWFVCSRFKVKPLLRWSRYLQNPIVCFYIWNGTTSGTQDSEGKRGLIGKIKYNINVCVKSVVCFWLLSVLCLTAASGLQSAFSKLSRQINSSSWYPNDSHPSHEAQLEARIREEDQRSIQTSPSSPTNPQTSPTEVSSTQINDDATPAQVLADSSNYYHVVLSYQKAVRWTAFALYNLFFVLLYYLFLYDSEGTVKPYWTELLG